MLSAHDSFESVESAIKEEKDIHSTLENIESTRYRLLVSDTDMGKTINKKINDLHALVDAYRKGTVKEP
jgi:fructose-1,6-bisphosphatase-3